MTHEPSILLDGDGRQMVDPFTKILRTMPFSLRRSAIRRLIKNFESTGESHHSADAGTLWVIIEHCQTQGINYTLTAHPGLGYSVKRIEE